jgi:hypothetical protein
MFRYFGTISSFYLNNRAERLVPFMAISAIYLVMTFLFFNKLPISINFNKLISIIAALVVISTIITFFYKVSVHSLAICGMVGMITPLNKAVENEILLVPTMVVIFISGIVMSARLYLNAHTLNEVLFGALIGFITGLAGIMILF